MVLSALHGKSVSLVPIKIKFSFSSCELDVGFWLLCTDSFLKETSCSPSFEGAYICESQIHHHKRNNKPSKASAMHVLIRISEKLYFNSKKTQVHLPNPSSPSVNHSPRSVLLHFHLQNDQKKNCPSPVQSLLSCKEKKLKRS